METIKEKIKRMSDIARGRPRAILVIPVEGDRAVTEEKKEKHVFTPNWIGQVGDGITSTVRFNGEIVSTSRVRCSACSGNVNLNSQIDFAVGSTLASAKHDMQDCLKYLKSFVELQEKGRKGETTLDGYLDEQERLNVELAKNMSRYERSTVQSGPVNVICPKCQSSLGDVSVELSRKSFEGVPALTLEEMDLLPLSHKMTARITHDWRFRDIAELYKWRNFEDIKTAKTLIENFQQKIQKIPSLEVQNILSDIQSATSRALDMLDKETWERRRILRDALVKIIQTEKVKAIL